MKYKSTIDLETHIHLWSTLIINVTVLIYFIHLGGLFMIVIAIFLLLCSIFLIFPRWLNSCYILEDDALIVKYGLGRGTKIPYSSVKSIKNVKKSKNLFASTALSKDRIEIKYGFAEMVVISPIDIQEFSQQLEQRIK